MDIHEALRLLEDTLGHAFIKKEVHKMDGWNPESSINLHPLVLLWYKIREESGFTELTDAQPNSQRSRELLTLADLIQNVKDDPEFPRLQSLLRDLEHWEAAIAQMRELKT
ncbi:hypothetical protein [Desulfotomaculum sp. 1211_IL3151]|uniref:hypothetical protein n=1 Tax=Desulfotomaculum sp. 1211_IL3151 TaxID=3084055 RepID=UPI002FDA4398